MTAFLFLIIIPIGIAAISKFIGGVKTAGKKLMDEEEGRVLVVDETGSLTKKYLEYDRF